MKVQVKQRGWSKAPDCIEWQHPDGYYNYLLIAANGIVCLHHEWADSNKLIPEGEYDMPDSMFDYDDPKWEAESEVIYE